MDFNDNKPIYRQIVDWCHEQILSGLWKEGERVPSVRELGTQLSVNSHTALKAYDVMQLEGVVMQRRGMGFYLAEDAVAKVREARREEFFDETLPALFDRMRSLGITMADIEDRFSLHRQKQKSLD